MKNRLTLLGVCIAVLVTGGASAGNDFSSCAPGDDDSQFVQSRIEEAKTGDGIVRLPKGCFRITRQILIQNAPKGIEFEMPPMAEVEAWVPGEYAFKISNTNYGVFKLNIVIKTPGGRGVLFESSPDTGNTMYNTLSGRIVGDTRNHPAEIPKPAQGDGSIGVGFRLTRDAGSGDGAGGKNVIKYANYFNRIRDLVVRKIDTGIFLGFESNAQTIDNLQVEKYWYGVIIHSDENRLVSGFCHQSFGRNEAQQTECIHIGAPPGFNRFRAGAPAKTHTTFNQIMGFTGEPGAMAKMLVMEGGNKGNFIQIGDNTSSPNVTEPQNHIIRWRSASLAGF